MSDVIWELQRAIYTQLSTDTGVKALIGDPARIYDNPPEGTAFPYLVIGATSVKDFKGVDGGLEHDLRLHVFSTYAGRKEIKQVIGAVYDALHDASLTLVGHNLINIRFVFGDAFRRQDGETYQGVARFRAVTQPN